MQLAPVVLFVYNRLQHTRQTVAALQQNELAADSELIVFSDGPHSEADLSKVLDVRDYLQTITGFKTVTVRQREKNFGCERSMVEGISEVVNAYGRIVVLEDDIVTSPFFLRYMNEGLEFYRNETKVACIHGYLYPLKAKLPETFFLQGADNWGWGTWKRGWELYEADGRKLLSELKARKLTRSFDFDGQFGYTRMLETHDTWDVHWYASAFLRGKLTLYPGRSLVRNIGFDSSGTHCGSTDIFSTQLAAGPIEIKAIPLEQDLFCRKEIGRFQRWSGPGAIRNTWRKLTLWLKGM